MYRIVVVDNEPYIVDWIATLLENKCKREVDVYRAYSAKEALKWFAQTRIDVLVSDICMPGMDGLELAEKVKEYWSCTKVILLTGFAEFDYAVSAIRNNVAGYVLKNQGDDVILKEVEHAIALLDDDMKQKCAVHADADMCFALPMLRNRLLCELLEKGCYDENMYARMQSLGMELKADTPVYMVVSDTREWKHLNNMAQRFHAVQNMIRQVQEYLGDCCAFYAADMGGSRLVWMLYGNHKASLTMQIITLIQGRLEIYQNTADIRHSFVLCPKECCLQNLHDTYLEMAKIMERISWEKDVLFLMDSVEAKKRKVDTEEINRRIRIGLDEGKYDLVLDEILYCSNLLKSKTLEQSECYSLYYAIAVPLNYYVEKNELVRTQNMIIFKEQLFYPPANETWDEKFDGLRELAKEAFELESKLKSGISQNTVQELKKYISDHICEDISLTRLSEVTGYSANYLSRIFRMQTGEKLIEFIGKQKMERIDELMKDSQMDIGEIAEKTGFQSRTYFNRFIKRWTGMSPKDYRKRLRREYEKN